MASEDDDIVRLAPQDDAAAAAPEIAIHLSSSPSSSSSPSPSRSLTVIAPLPWLSRVPYFDTLLQDPWSSSSSPPLHVSLHCTPSSTPRTYLRCLQLLHAPHPCSPHMFASIADVLELLPVADHLLFQDCWDACMSFLAASPWSCEEEDDIRATIYDLSLKASSDVRERLDTSKDVDALEDMLSYIISPPTSEHILFSLCENYLKSSQGPSKAVFLHVLLKLHTSYATKVLPIFVTYSFISRERVRVRDRKKISHEWYVLTKLLLQFTDGYEIILQLMKLEDVLWLMIHSNDREEDAVYIIKDILNKVLTKVVFLSNSQRAMLLKQFDGCENATIKSMRLSLSETLPLANPHRISTSKRDCDKCSMWLHHLFHRIGQLDDHSVKDICEAKRATGSEDS